MATIYVDSAAVGLDDGTSWTDAYPTFLQGVNDAGIAAGDEIWVEKDHSESPTTAQTYSTVGLAQGNPVRVLAIDSVDDSLFTPDWDTDTAPAITSNDAAADMIINGPWYMWGIKFNASTSSTLFDFEGDNNQEFHHCWFVDDSASDQFQIGSGTNAGSHVYYDCIFDCGTSTGARFIDVHQGTYRFYDCEFIGTNRDIGFLFELDTKDFLAVGCDFTSMKDNDAPSGQSGRMVFQDCILATSAAWLDGDIATGDADIPNTSIFYNRCHIGTVTDPPISICQLDPMGATGAISNLTTYAVDAGAMTATYRLGGLTDGVRNTPICWPMMAHGNETIEGFRGHRSPPMYVWIEGDGTAKTLTVRFASGGGGDGTGGRWQDDQLWLEVISGNDAASNSKGIFTTTRLAPRGTAADLADDTSAWVGASVGTKQKLTASVSPDLEGPATVWVVFAPGDATDQTIFIDPIVEVT